MFRLDRKIALVTGGAKGIGESICRTFADRGARVCIMDTDATAGSDLSGAIRDSGGDARFYNCDQSRADQVREAIDAVVKDMGNPDILVNNAAVSHIGTVETTSEADMDRLLNINVKGVYNVLHRVLPLMKDKGGVVLNLASVAASLGLAERFAYSTTKGAVATMTLSVARDYLQFGIRCNSISPARVHTPFVDGYLREHYPGRESEMFEKLSHTQPIGRMARPEEIAAMALYLCSDEAAFLTGCDYPIDGGFKNLNT